jgi:taurine dioxygenase
VEVTADSGATVTFRGLGGGFGALVEGVDLSTELDPSVVAVILDGFRVHHLLCFPRQGVTPDDEERALRLFDGISDSDDSTGLTVPGHPAICILSNIVDDDGAPIGYTNRRGMEWHTDGSGWAQPAAASLLYAIEVPASGGETYFANGHVAYESLASDERARLDGMRATYSWVTLQHWLAEAAGSHKFLTAEERARYPDVVRPLVRVHPATGRKALWFSAREIVDVDGMGVEATRDLLSGLVDRMVATPHVVYRHDWAPGDLVVWDNRCLLHSVCEYNYEGQRRLMHQITGRDPEFAV